MLKCIFLGMYVAFRNELKNIKHIPCILHTFFVLLCYPHRLCNQYVINCKRFNNISITILFKYPLISGCDNLQFGMHYIKDIEDWNIWSCSERESKQINMVKVSAWEFSIPMTDFCLIQLQKVFCKIIEFNSAYWLFH